MKVRFITATALFDNDETSIHNIRKSLLKQGAEVIHLGLSRSPQELVKAATEEDAHAIVITSPLSAYRSFYVALLQQLQQNGTSETRLFTPDAQLVAEKKDKKTAAVSLRCEPLAQTGEHSAVVDMITRAQFSTLSLFFERGYEIAVPPKNNRMALSKYASLLTCSYEELGENSQLPRARTQLQELVQSCDRKIPVIGVAGSGGTGKSSLVDEMVGRLQVDFPDAYIAVVAMDPRKRKGGGAVLEDRVRMNNIYNDHVFMRSLATPHLNYLYDFLPTLSNLFKMAGYDFVLVETPGIGQVEADIAAIVDISIYAMTGEYGSYSLLEKINMLDFADMVAVNKFEHKGCEDALVQIRQYFRAGHNIAAEVPDEALPVFATLTSKFNDPGVTLLYLHLLGLIRNKLGVEYVSRQQGKINIGDAFSSHRADAIIPYDRIHYLGDISKLAVGNPLSLAAQTQRTCAAQRYVSLPSDLQQAGQQLSALVQIGANPLLCFDAPTLYGIDYHSSAEASQWSIDNGLHIACWEDFKSLFAGFDLTAAGNSVLLYGRSFSPVLLAMFLHCAIDQQRMRYCQENNLPADALIPPEGNDRIRSQAFSQLRGAFLWNLPGEMLAYNNSLFSLDFTWRMLADVLQYWQQQQISGFCPSAISGHWMAQAGATVPTQLAFTLANGFTLVEFASKCGIDLDQLCSHLYFLFGLRGDQTENSVMGSVARHIWETALAHRYSIKETSRRLHYGIMRVAPLQSDGDRLAEQESDFVCCASSEQGMQTAAETGAPSIAAEQRQATAMKLQEAVLQILEELDRRGGVINAMEYNYQRYRLQQECTQATAVVPMPAGQQQNQEEERASLPESSQHTEEGNKFQKKNELMAKDALKKFQIAINEGNGNMFCELMQVVKYCTLGEIMQILHKQGATYRRGV